MPLPREHLLDELATAYVQAIAAVAGATMAASRLDYGVDGALNHIVRAKSSRSVGNIFVPEGFSVEFQLKGASTAGAGAEFIAYDLSVRSYDLIATRDPMATPLYLFLVCFGPDTADWFAVSERELILRATAFWWRQPAAPTENVSTVRVRVPTANRLTPDAIADMLKASRNRFGLI